jgi:predicted amidohydrolase YtcJ
MRVLIVNARIATGDSRRPWADAVVCDGPTVLAIGSSAELRKRFGAQARVIDAKGAQLVPDDVVSMAAVIDLPSPEALP